MQQEHRQQQQQQRRQQQQRARCVMLGRFVLYDMTVTCDLLLQLKPCFLSGCLVPCTTFRALC